jgi:hypothetical protein
MWRATAGGRTSVETRDVFATPWLAQAGPQTATAVLIPFLDLPSTHRAWVAAGFSLGAIARDAALIPETEDLLARVARPVPPPGDEQEGMGRCESYTRGNRRLALTHGEIRVLHYLPTNLCAREIAGELHVSVDTCVVAGPSRPRLAGCAGQWPIPARALPARRSQRGAAENQNTERQDADVHRYHEAGHRCGRLAAGG